MNNKVLKLGISPCPNDTFAFYKLIMEKDSLPFDIEVIVEDVETLNRMMLAGELDFTKVSFHAFGHAADRYILLRSGSALGRGCGPLLLAGKDFDPMDITDASVAIPGEYTTAALLLRLYNPDISRFIPMRFSDIPAAVRDGVVDAGLVIHEIRFTYSEFGLEPLRDLGEWWEKVTGLPIPLGGIVARRELPSGWLYALNRRLKESIDYAWKHWDEVKPFMQRYAADMSPDIMRQHVRLYVNSFTRELGPQGEDAVRLLFQKGADCGIFQDCFSCNPLISEQGR
jgi:1,4-dihydroxy-6-naphthoate synthase